MIIERLRITNFQSYGPEGEELSLSHEVTTFVGGNGAGKTAALTAISRLFGVNRAQRSVVKSDFHMLIDSSELTSGTLLLIEVIFAFPELETDDGDSTGAVAEFWRQMAASGVGDSLKVRVQLRATWIDDGTPEGSIEEDVRWITRLDEDFDWDDCPKVSAADRSAVQMIYIPAVRNASDQVKALLRGRLWRAARWSDELSETVANNTDEIQQQFSDEEPIAFIQERLARRWSQVHSGDSDTDPIVRLLEHRFESLIRGAEVRFQQAPDGLERELDRLSDGQRSLFQIALTAATLEVEQDASALDPLRCPFDQSKLRRVALTILAIEEPENNLSPFFLSKIMSLAADIGQMATAQVVIASHSASILSRVEPQDIRYFRQTSGTRQTRIRRLTLPEEASDASAYVRLAVRAYPELYFARFVVLVEGDSEQIVLPRIAEAKGITLDKSFVPVVPLGGRYVGHFWRLLNDIEIPHATLLDLDFGREHGGPGAIRSVGERLSEVGIDLANSLEAYTRGLSAASLVDLKDEDLVDANDKNSRGYGWINVLRDFGVFFSDPLDVDFSMLTAFPDAYKVIPEGGRGPNVKPDAIEARKKRTLKTGGKPELYEAVYDDDFVWYPYLFLDKSKPHAHLAALSRIEVSELAEGAPQELKDLIDHIAGKLDTVGS